MATRNPPQGVPRILARLAYEDVGNAIRFLESAFGFTEHVDARITDANGQVTLAELEFADSRIMVGQAGAHGISSPKTLGGTTQTLVVFVDGIDAHYERARSASAEIVSEPADQFWGDRRYEARDVEGHLWSFHEHVRDVSREEMAEALSALRRR